MQLILNTSFITLNEYIDASRSNRYIAANLKKFHDNKVSYLAKEQNFSLPKDTKFDVLITWYKPDNRHDHDNIAFAIKFVLDGLVKAEILKSDSPKFINSISHEFEVDKTRNYISCKIEFKEIWKH